MARRSPISRTEVTSPQGPRTGPRVAMTQVFKSAGDFFQRRSPVHLAAEELAHRLRRLGVPFAVTGGFALGGYGYERMTDDVDIVVRPDDWKRFKDAFVGLGYREKFAGSKAVIDTEHKVNIDVRFTGDYPGDGKPKPVAFPDPEDPDAVAPTEPFPVVTLETLIELKIACGKTAPGRRYQDYADVMALIRANALPASFAARLDPYVRDTFLELHRDAAEPTEPP